jgi:hypothetical protein
MVKYFAQYRISEPRRAVTYIQVAIWFHLLVGIIEIGILGLVACVLLPRTGLAFLSWIVILHSITQFPGLVLIFRDLFRALQRYDFSVFLILIDFLVNALLQMGGGLYGRHYGLMHRVFGEGMGVVFGFALGSFLAQSLLIGISAIFYRGVGFDLSTIFLAHFERSTVTHALNYGLKLSVGPGIGALTTAMIPFVLGRGHDNFLELNEIFAIVYGLTLGYLEASAFIFSNLMLSISESMAAGKMALTRRYIDQGLRWGLLMLAILGGAYVGFSDLLIRGLPPHQFARAVGVIALMHVWRMMDFTARLPDEVLQATGRTGLLSWAITIEHVSRILLIVLLLGEFGFPALFYASIVGSVIKSLASFPDDPLRHQAAGGKPLSAPRYGSRQLRACARYRCELLERPGTSIEHHRDVVHRAARCSADLHVRERMSGLGRELAAGVPRRRRTGARSFRSRRTVRAEHVTDRDQPQPGRKSIPREAGRRGRARG